MLKEKLLGTRCFVISTILSLVLFMLAPAWSQAPPCEFNETSFVPLLPNGGALWRSDGFTHLAEHPQRNRAFTVAVTLDNYSLIHLDPVTAAAVASTTTIAGATWDPLDLEVWGAGEEVLIAWGEVGVGGNSEVAEGKALERIDVNTAVSRGTNSAVRYHAFTMDQGRDIAYGIASSTTSPNFLLTALSLPTSIVSATGTLIAATSAVVREVLLDATRQDVFTFYQAINAGGTVDRGGFIVAYRLPGGSERGRVQIPVGMYRMGGMALDAQREFLYVLTREPGSDQSIFRIRTTDMTLDATFTPAQFSTDYETSGAIAVHAPTGHVLLSNGKDRAIENRILRVDFSQDPPVVIRNWGSGADPSRILYSWRLNRVLVASRQSQSVTLIHPQRSPELLQAPLGIFPYAFVYEAEKERLLLSTVGGELFAIDPRKGRLTDKLNNLGVIFDEVLNQPRVGIQLDPPRKRFIAETFSRAEPAVFDSGSFTRLGDLPRMGASLAISASEGYLFQPEASFFPTVPIHISSATDGSLIRSIPANSRFGRSTALAVDEERKLLYGISIYRVWAVNWQTEISSDLVLPATSETESNLQWTLFTHIAVAGNESAVAVAGTANATGRLLIYQSHDDENPFLYSFPPWVLVFDLIYDPVHRLFVVLTQDTASGEITIHWVGLESPRVIGSCTLDLPSVPRRMALDTGQSILWLASSLPAGLYRVNWPPESVFPKMQKMKGLNASLLAVQALPARNQLEWMLDPQPPQGSEIQILRQDGQLAAFRPLLPAGLPAEATQFTDSDVIPGLLYRYRVECSGPATLATAESDWTAALPRKEETVLVRPLTWLNRIPVGATTSMTIALEGNFKMLRYARVELAPGYGEIPASILHSLSPAMAPIPGFLSLDIEVLPGAVPGIYRFPVRVDFEGQSRMAWLFLEVSVPFGQLVAHPPEYPAMSRSIGIHTDSFLREKDEYRLVLKGEIGALLGNVAGTGIVAKVDLGDGRIVEQNSLVASGDYYSTSIDLPLLASDTVIRAQVTWLGSSVSPGGTSPILRLPVGAYSSGLKKVSQTNAPEKAIFILGKTPTDLEPVPTAEDLQSIVQDAESTLLGDFVEENRSILEDKDAVLEALSGQDPVQTLFLYAVADTSSGVIELSDGSSLSLNELRDWVNQLPEDTLPILMIEGPRSGASALPSMNFSENATVITSSHIDDENNRLTPWGSSFSSRFFYKCRQGRTLAECYQAAELTFLDRFAGQLQSPQLVGERAQDALLAGRFFTASLPDLTPPEILRLNSTVISEEPKTIQVEVFVSDNRDTAPALGVAGRLSFLEEESLEPLEFTAPVGPNAPHTTILLNVATPGVGLVLSATDSAGNISTPSVFWLSASNNALPFDVDGNGKVEQNDVLYLQNMDSRDLVIEQWLFDFVSHWMNEAGSVGAQWHEDHY